MAPRARALRVGPVVGRQAGLVARAHRGGVLAGLVLVGACAGSSEAPSGVAPVADARPVDVAPPKPAPALPDLALAVPDHASLSPLAAPASKELAATRATLAAVVAKWGFDPNNAWAIGHALQGLGSDGKMPDGGSAVDFLFATYAERATIGAADVVRFMKARGDIRVEPHSGLTIKILTDMGVKPDRAVTVQGAPAMVGDLWRGTVLGTWVDGDTTSLGSWNDTPWTLQAITAWAPPAYAWTADGGHAMTVDLFTHAVVQKLVLETAFLREAKASGGTFQKQKQGIFAYTCGGAHLLQGASYAVSRGFGTPEDRAAVVDALHVQAWRFPIELGIIDDMLVRVPKAKSLLLVQRLKMVGHHLETLQRGAAEGLLGPADKDIVDSVALAERELIAAAAAIVKSGAFDAMPEVRAANEQVFLDLIGDSAHAVHGIDLSTGAAGVWK